MKRELIKGQLTLDLQSAEARKGKVSYFIEKFWTEFEQGISKNTQM